MKARHWTRKRLTVAVAVVLVAVPVAYAVSAAQARTEMRFACAKKSTGELRYVKRAGACTAGERLIRLRDGRSRTVCAHRGGFVYLVRSPAACSSAKHRPSLTIVLPDDVRRNFCADKATGRLRSTRHAPYTRQRPPRARGRACKSSEKKVFVKATGKRPRAVDDQATVDEDHSASLAVLANDVAKKNKPLEVASVDTTGTQGSVAIAADGLSVTYDPNGKFEALGVGASATDAFSYVATDGKKSDGASVTVTVTGVNDAPSAVADSGSTDEDTATTIAVLANDSDPDQGDVLSVSAVNTAGTAGVVTINQNGTLGYDPAGALDDLAAGEQRADSFGYTASDGHGGSASATVSVTVGGVNDAPVVTTSAGSLAYTEGDPATVIDGALTVADPDDTSLARARVRISAGFQPADELQFTDQSGITGTYDSGTGVLTLSGTSSVANYQSALRSVEYEFTGDDPEAVKTIEFRADDGDGLGPASTRVVAITGVNDAPVAAPGSRSTDEDTPLALDLAALVSDAETADADLTYEIVTPAAHGTATATTYTPDPNFNGTDSFTFRVTDRGDPDGCSSAPCDGPETSTTETVSITVDPVNDVPQADSTSESIDEDGSLPIDLTALVDDVETVDADLTYTIVSPPAHGVLSGSGGSRTYTPAADFNGADSFTYTVTDRGDPDSCGAPGPACDGPETSSTETVSITVGAVNDAPVNVLPPGPVVALPDTDTPLTGISVTDVDAGTDDVQVEFSVAHGTLTVNLAVLGGVGGLDVTGDGTATVTVTASLLQINTTLADADGLVYTPGSGYTGPDTLAVDTSDLGHNGSGGPLTDSDTLGIVVSPPDIPPTAVDDSATVAEDAAATSIDVLANDTDLDAGPKVIALASDPANGDVVLTGGSAGAHTGLTYEPADNYCNAPPGTTPDTFTYTLNGGSTATVSVTVTCVDDNPIAVDNSATVPEDAGPTTIDVLTNDTDVDGGQKTISSATDPANGTVVLTGGPPATGLTYQPDPNYCNNPPGSSPDTFTYTLNGGSTATVSVTVDCVPDNPVVDTSAGNTSYTENAAATVIDAAVTVSDPDAGTTIVGATVKITGNYAGAEDILALAGVHPGISPSVAGDTLTLTGNASPAAYQSALRDVTYRNSSDNPSTADRTVTFTVTDDTARSGSDTKGITVIAVDDPPTAVNDSATVLEDAAATAVTVLTNDTDVDAGTKSIGSVTQPANGTVAITGGGTGLTYQPNPNYCNNPPGTTPDTFTYTLNGGSNATVSMTVTCVNDAPVADDETFNGVSSAVGNTTLNVNDPSDGRRATPDPTDTAPVTDRPHKEITGDILAGDTDVDTATSGFTVTAGTFATTDGGTVTIEADGDFNFEPAASTSCTDTSDSFNYTLSDNDALGNQTDTGTVTIAISGCVWYVNNNDADGDSGTSEKPFNTLAQAQTASGTGHSIFVYDGNDSSTPGYTAGISLKANQKLIGEAAALIVGSDNLHAADAANKPSLTDSNADVVELDDANEVRGINIDPAGTGGGIAGASGDTGGATIDDVDIVDVTPFGTQPGFELDATTGTFNVSNLTVSTNGAIGVRLNSAGTVNFASAGTISTTSSGAAGLVAIGGVGGTSMGNSTFDSITVTGSGSGGVSLTNTTGTTTFGDLSLTTTSGATAGFGLANAGSVSVPGAGTANVSATGGPAVDVTGTPGATLAFDDVDSASSANDGINIDGLGAGTFSANTTSTITGAAGIAFDVNGGSGTVDFNGTIANGEGTAAEITGRSGAIVSLDGAITDTGDSDAVQESAIALSGNTGGSTEITNATKVLNTGEDHAIVMGTSDNHTLTISGGTLDIDTTSGKGLEATTSGTLVVSGTGNTIDSVSATALNVANTDFTATGATFQRVSSGNNTAAADPANGIVLNNTGASGGLTVTGNAGACTFAVQTCTGGNIANTTGDSVSLTSTSSPSLSLMNIHDGAGNGVLASGVSGLSIANSILVSNSDDLATNNEANLRMNNMSGTSTITSSVFRDAAVNNVYWTPNSGAATVNATGSTFGPNDPATGGSGLLLDATATASPTLSISGGSFTGNRGDSLRPAFSGSASGNVTVSGGTTFSDSNSGANFSVDSNADLTWSVTGSTFLRHNSHALQMIVNDTTTVQSSVHGTAASNTIGDTNADSGSRDANGISYDLEGAADIVLSVTGNTIRHTDTQGIFIQTRRPISPASAGPTADLTLRDNTVTNIDDNSAFPFLFQHGTQIRSRNNSNLCLDIAGNTSTGIGGAQHFRVAQSDASVFRLERLTGSGTDDTNVANFVAGQNDAGSTAIAAHNTSFTSVSDGTCRNP